MLLFISAIVLVIIVPVNVGAVGPSLPEPYTPKCMVDLKNLYPPPKETALKWYTVNLDKAPEDRWTEIATEYKTEIRDLIGVITNITYAFFKGKLVKWVDNHLDNWDDKFPSPYREELNGIAKATGMPLGELVFYNIFYELTSMCTAILGEDRNGNLYHARNMDFGFMTGWNPETHEWLIPEKIRKLQIQVKFTRSGSEVFQGVVFPGFLGVFSAMKKNRFTLTLNERNDPKGGYLGLIKWLLGDSSQNFTTFLARDVMERCDSYAEAKDILMTRNLSSPIYYLLGGNKSGDGCLIIRGLTDMPGKIELSESPNRWYILQTNYDPWDSPGYLDDRRTPGNKCTQKLGQERLDFSGLFNVLSSTPNFNLLTIFTHLMDVNTGMETYSQRCKQPCWYM